MIRPEHELTIEWVPLTDIRFDDQPIDPDQVAFYTRTLHGTTGHVAPPILNSDYSIRDGRHRLHAHRNTGRATARCIIVKETP